MSREPCGSSGVHWHVAIVQDPTVRVTVKKQCRRAVTSYPVRACSGKGRDKWLWSSIRLSRDRARRGPSNLGRAWNPCCCFATSYRNGMYFYVPLNI